VTRGLRGVGPGLSPGELVRVRWRRRPVPVASRRASVACVCVGGCRRDKTRLTSVWAGGVRCPHARPDLLRTRTLVRVPGKESNRKNKLNKKWRVQLALRVYDPHVTS
jgi:hypothetical protein